MSPKLELCVIIVVMGGGCQVHQLVYLQATGPQGAHKGLSVGSVPRDHLERPWAPGGPVLPEIPIGVGVKRFWFRAMRGGVRFLVPHNKGGSV